MPRFVKAIALSLPLAAPAAAHDGVKDPRVKARMQIMSQIGDATKVLGNMARGKTAFDAEAAGKAKADLEKAAAKVVPSFTPQASDPKSEAKPEIWTRFDSFTEKSDALTAAATATDISSLPVLRQGFGAIGQTCKSCHSDFRTK